MKFIYLKSLGCFVAPLPVINVIANNGKLWTFNDYWVITDGIILIV